MAQIVKGEVGSDVAYLLPRYTTANRLLFTPSSEALVYDTTEQAVYLWNGTTWVSLAGIVPSSLIDLNTALSKNDLFLHDSGAGNIVTVGESITTLERTNTTELSYNQEGGTTQIVDISQPEIYLTNTDTTTDIVTGQTGVISRFSELTGTVRWNDDTAVFQENLTLGTVDILVTGRYDVNGAFAWEEGGGANARNNIRFFFTDGPQALASSISPYFQNNYVRDASGNTETGQLVSFSFEVTNVPFTLAINRQQIAGGNGVMTLVTNNNFLRIRKTR